MTSTDPPVARECGVDALVEVMRLGQSRKNVGEWYFTEIVSTSRIAVFSQLRPLGELMADVCVVAMKREVSPAKSGVEICPPGGVSRVGDDACPARLHLVVCEILQMIIPYAVRVIGIERDVDIYHRRVLLCNRVIEVADQ